jgi:hypothetical protein
MKKILLCLLILSSVAMANEKLSPIQHACKFLTNEKREVLSNEDMNAAMQGMYTIKGIHIGTFMAFRFVKFAGLVPKNLNSPEDINTICKRALVTIQKVGSINNDDFAYAYADELQAYTLDDMSKQIDTKGKHIKEDGNTSQPHKP